MLVVGAEEEKRDAGGREPMGRSGVCSILKSGRRASYRWLRRGGLAVG